MSAFPPLPSPPPTTTTTTTTTNNNNNNNNNNSNTQTNGFHVAVHSLCLCATVRVEFQDKVLGRIQQLVRPLLSLEPVA